MTLCDLTSCSAGIFSGPPTHVLSDAVQFHIIKQYRPIYVLQCTSLVTISTGCYVFNVIQVCYLNLGFKSAKFEQSIKDLAFQHVEHG